MSRALVGTCKHLDLPTVKLCVSWLFHRCRIFKRLLSDILKLNCQFIKFIFFLLHRSFLQNFYQRHQFSDQISICLLRDLPKYVVFPMVPCLVLSWWSYSIGSTESCGVLHSLGFFYNSMFKVHFVKFGRSNFKQMSMRFKLLPIPFLLSMYPDFSESLYRHLCVYMCVYTYIAINVQPKLAISQKVFLTPRFASVNCENWQSL